MRLIIQLDCYSRLSCNEAVEFYDGFYHITFLPCAIHTPNNMHYLLEELFGILSYKSIFTVDLSKVIF